MKLTISNIAWKSYSDYFYLKLIKKYKIKSLEYAPDIILKGDYSTKNIIKTKKYWDSHKIRLYSMQSILFGSKNTYMFGDKIQKNIFVKEIIKKIDLAHKLGSKILIFGSPKNRIIFKNYLKLSGNIILDKNKKINVLYLVVKHKGETYKY